MKQKKEPVPPAPSEERRAQFAPHHNPRKQPDGDPGPNSAREGSEDQRGTDTPERVQDDGTDD
jgi:hypothetical protein